MTHPQALPDTGPEPWTPGSGLTPEDVRDVAMPMLAMRAKGLPVSGIADALDMPVARVLATLVRTAHAIIHDLGEYGHSTDLPALDDLAREDDVRAAGGW